MTLTGPTNGQKIFQQQRWIQQLSVGREEFQNIFRQLGEQLGDESVIHWEPDAGLLSQAIHLKL
jgi:hypothetical protein